MNKLYDFLFGKREVVPKTKKPEWRVSEVQYANGTVKYALESLIYDKYHHISIYPSQKECIEACDRHNGSIEVKRTPIYP